MASDAFGRACRWERVRKREREAVRDLCGRSVRAYCFGVSVRVYVALRHMHTWMRAPSKTSGNRLTCQLEYRPVMSMMTDRIR